MSDTLLIAAMGTIIVAVFGVVWGLMRGEITELKAKSVAFEAQMVSLHTSNARSEERDKAFEKGIDRLTKAIDDFDTRIGQKIEALSRALDVGIRKHSPPSGTPATRYKCIPNDDEGKK